MDTNKLWAQRALLETAQKLEQESIKNRLLAYNTLEESVWETVCDFTGYRLDKMIGKHLFLDDDEKIKVSFLYREKDREIKTVEVEIDVKNNEIHYI
jgi:hypothetical protein